LQEARAALEEALELHRQAGDSLATGRALTALSLLLGTLGDAAALATISEAVALLEAQPPGRELVAAYGREDVLIQVADRLSRCLRDGDTAARFGGDEFAVVLEPATESDATRVADRIDEALQSIAMPNGLPPVTASIGIAISSNRAIDGGAMVHLADLAMYRAKSTHRRRAVSLQK